jgi:beta-lactamase class A
MTRLFSSRTALLLMMLGCGDADRAGASSASPPPSTSAAAPESALPSPSASASPVSTPAVDPWLAGALRAADPRWEGWLADAEGLRLQILVTVVDGSGTWQTHELRADAEYFYPASAIKTFLAVAALRVLSERQGEDIPLGSRIVRCRMDKPGCEPPKEDEAKDQDPSDEKKKHEKLFVGEEVQKMLSYSDNDSYNRLYDIVGHRELNDEVAEMGFPAVRFHHRMSAPADRSRTTLRVVVRPPGKRELTFSKRTSTFDPAPTPAGKLEVGTSYRDEKRGTVEEPLSFANKNYVSLRDLHRMNASLVFPDRQGAARLGLSQAQREHLLKAMTTRLQSRKHAAEHSPISPGVVDVMGDDRIRYVGKSGRAYGFHLDNAFIEDKKTGRAFFVTATVYSNPDGVMNDDDYGYDATTRPLLASLGAALARAVFEKSGND